VPEREVRRAGKVIDASWGRGQDLARGQRALVGLEVARRVREVQGVVPDLVRGRVPVRVEVEVRVLGQHEGYRPGNVLDDGRKYDWEKG
jgi:hypothetical protein